MARSANPRMRIISSEPVVGTELTVVLPTYNEASSIADVVREIRDVLTQSRIAYKILVLDDASPDGTADLIDSQFALNPDIRVIRRTGPRGLAFSIREGLREANAERILVMDADFNHNPSDIPRLLEQAPQCDIVSGSRFLPGGGMYNQTRQRASRAMNLFVRFVLRSRITDSLAGFFIITRELAEALPEDRIFWGYGDFYIRLLWYAEKQGANILEIPVVYRSRESGESKTPLVRTALRYAFEIVKLAMRG